MNMLLAIASMLNVTAREWKTKPPSVEPGGEETTAEFSET